MAILNRQDPVVVGFNPAMAAASGGGDSYHNSGRERLLIRNASAGVLRINVDTPNPDNFGFLDNALDVVINVPAGAERYLAGPFRTDRHNDVNQRVQLTYPDGVANLSLAVIAT